MPTRKLTPHRIQYLKEYNVEWKKKNTRTIALRFMLKGDADILARLDSMPSKLEYVRQLIRKDIEEQGIKFNDED